MYHPGKENACSDVFSLSPVAATLSGTVNDDSVQIAHLESSSLAITNPEPIQPRMPSSVDLAQEKWKDLFAHQMMFLTDGTPYLVMHKVLEK